MREERIKYILLILGFILLIIFCLTPFIYMLSISLSKNFDFLSEIKNYNLTLNNYYSVLTEKSLHFIDYLLNSIIVSALSAIICIFIAALAAYAFTRFELPGKIFILLFILAVSMFPQISLVGYIFKLMSELGLINTYYALIFPYIAWILPLSLWILVSYFSQIPKDLDKAALIDGASHWQVLYKIIIPVSAPGLLSTALLAFISAFNEFMFALMLTTDHNARTVPVGLALFQGLHGEMPWGNIMAASAIAVLPVFVLVILFQRHIMQGLTRGAIKG